MKARGWVFPKWNTPVHMQAEERKRRAHIKCMQSRDNLVLLLAQLNIKSAFEFDISWTRPGRKPPRKSP